MMVVFVLQEYESCSWRVFPGGTNENRESVMVLRPGRRANQDNIFFILPLIIWYIGSIGVGC